MSNSRFHLPLAMITLALGLATCSSAETQTYQGWIEANLVFVGPDESGRVETLAFREGDTVLAGAALFTLDADLQQADVMQSAAIMTNARQAFERAQQLLKTNSGTQKAFDDAQAALREVEARLNSAQTRLARRRVASPAAGTIQQVYYRPGELVPAGRPVVALLPPANLKVRFFVPQAMLPRITFGDAVKIHCDGCGEDLSARVSFIARTSEFTPPVIYSQEERSKLVFLVEARPDQPERLRVGQPISVILTPRGASK